MVAGASRAGLAVLAPFLLAAGAACGGDGGAGDVPEDADAAPADDGAPADDAGDEVEPDAAESDGPADEPTGDEGGADVPEDDGGPPVDPSVPGPFTWTTVDDTVVRGTRSTPAQALIPDAPAGTTMPLLLFLPGFQMRTAWYLPLLERIASHGFVVVRADPPASLLDNNHPELALDAQAALDWALDPAGAVGPHVDPSRIAAAGHSNGGKISTMLAYADPRVGALLGLDPVNGRGPTGFNPQQPDIVPEMVEPLAIPWGIFGETTDTAGGLSGQACAPVDLNFQTFYDAATSSPWIAAWELVGADHADFVFDTVACGLFCRLCVEGTADAATVHEIVQTLAVAFLRFHFFGEPGMERWLLGDLLPAGVNLQHRP